jgi:hypothetical protein
MLSDKDLTLRLLDVIEYLSLRNAALESVLEAKFTGQWQAYVQTLEENPEHKATIHHKLEPLRELVLAAPDLNAAVRRIVEESGGESPHAEGAAGGE